MLVAARVSAQTATWQATSAGTWGTSRGCDDGSTASARSLTPSGTVAGAVDVRSWRRFSLDGRAAASVGGAGCASYQLAGAAAIRASYATLETRVWIALSALSNDARDTTVRHPGLSAGIERRLGRTMLSMSVGPRLQRGMAERYTRTILGITPNSVYALPGTTVRQDTAYATDTVRRFVDERVPDVGFGMSWTHRAIGVNASAHVAVGNRMESSAPASDVELTYRITPRLATLANLATRGSIPALGVPSRRFVTLGVRIHGASAPRIVPNASDATTAAVFHVVRRNADSISIVVRAPGASSVDVAGDFSHWNAIPLRRGEDALWRAVVRADVGPHQISMRVDSGRWAAPPGLPPVPDEFGASVGLLVVK
jgi:hypothetical protein